MLKKSRIYTGIPILLLPVTTQTSFLSNVQSVLQTEKTRRRPSLVNTVAEELLSDYGSAGGLR